MSEFPSLPLFTDAYLADTRHLTAQEHGAYLLLLMMAWRLPDCRLPDDDAKLAKWACVDARTWKRIKPTVMEFWTPESGHWNQSRLSKEREYVSKRAEVNRENGKHGGRPKALETQGSGNPTGSVRVSEKNPPTPNPKPLVIEPSTQQTNAAREGVYDKLLEAASTNGQCSERLALGIVAMTDLIASGYDLDRDILPVVRAKARPDVVSWKFFVAAIVQGARDRAAIPPKPEAAAIDWPGRLHVYRESDTWPHAWGPKPGEPGCNVPAELLQSAAA